MEEEEEEAAAAEGIYLSENSDADVLTTGFVDQRVQLLRWKWAAERCHSRGGTLTPRSFTVKRVSVCDLHSDDSFSGLRRQTYSQLLVMRDQVCAGLRNRQTHSD